MDKMELSKNIEDIPSTSKPKPSYESLGMTHVDGTSCTLDKATCMYCSDPKNENNWDSRIFNVSCGANMEAEVRKLADFIKSYDFVRLAGKPTYHDSDSDSESQIEAHVSETLNAVTSEPPKIDSKISSKKESNE
jgi:hypothetical protein